MSLVLTPRWHMDQLTIGLQWMAELRLEPDRELANVLGTLLRRLGIPYVGIEGGSPSAATGATPSVAELMDLVQNAQDMAMALPHALLDGALVWELASHRELESHRELDEHTAKLGGCCSSHKMAHAQDGAPPNPVNWLPVHAQDGAPPNPVNWLPVHDLQLLAQPAIPSTDGTHAEVPMPSTGAHAEVPMQRIEGVGAVMGAPMAASACMGTARMMWREAIAEAQAAASDEIARVAGEPKCRAGPEVSVAPATALELSEVSVAPATALGSPALTLRVRKLHCEGCSETLHRALSAVAGVREVAVSIELPEEAEGLARIWGGSSGAPLDVSALINAAVAAGKPAEVFMPPASIEGPLDMSERAELHYLRRRVQDLEAAIARLSSLVVQRHPPS